jgi:pantoate--beta-alanine ligase
MRTLRTVSELREALCAPRRAGARIGLVATMGAFHEGHLSLMRRAREECEVVVVSLFVNPTQFEEDADLAVYPREEARDASLAEGVGVDLLFAPPVAEIYPDGFATTVSVSGITGILEGEHRGRDHFDGVATVVAKLLNIVHPDVAYFGQKDAQQVLVIRRLVRDLDLPVRIAVCPTVREPDGLAMSSRNQRLRGEDRIRATALHRSLSAARRAVGAGERDVNRILSLARFELEAAGVLTEYLQIVDPDTLQPCRTVSGEALAVVAARVGDVRLIDNQPLSTAKPALPRRPAAAAGSTT